jgi:hypothetical protein
LNAAEQYEYKTEEQIKIYCVIETLPLKTKWITGLIMSGLLYEQHYNILLLG